MPLTIESAWIKRLVMYQPPFASINILLLIQQTRGNEPALGSSQRFIVPAAVAVLAMIMYRFVQWAIRQNIAFS